MIGSVQTLATGVKNGVKQSKLNIRKVKGSKLQMVKDQASTGYHITQNFIKAQWKILVKGQGRFEWRSRGQGLKFTLKFFYPGREY